MISLFSGKPLAEGYLDLLPIRFFTFQVVGLPMDSSDRIVWQFEPVYINTKICRAV
ncbi:hypothetical protein [Nostoc sp. PCC 7107]|uniref:hypothetical protein n=1 Tax=Nostoc sp. PCC 7107 TaxID=317936 RepID=UPI00209D6A8C|nr:hypothetical protein [Nostoc sp. PCC 7107]